MILQTTLNPTPVHSVPLQFSSLLLSALFPLLLSSPLHSNLLLSPPRFTPSSPVCSIRFLPPLHKNSNPFPPFTLVFFPPLYYIPVLLSTPTISFLSIPFQSSTPLFIPPCPPLLSTPLPSNSLLTSPQFQSSPLHSTVFDPLSTRHCTMFQSSPFFFIPICNPLSLQKAARVVRRDLCCIQLALVHSVALQSTPPYSTLIPSSQICSILLPSSPLHPFLSPQFQLTSLPYSTTLQFSPSPLRSSSLLFPPLHSVLVISPTIRCSPLLYIPNILLSSSLNSKPPLLLYSSLILSSPLSSKHSPLQFTPFQSPPPLPIQFFSLLSTPLRSKYSSLQFTLFH